MAWPQVRRLCPSQSKRGGHRAASLEGQRVLAEAPGQQAMLRNLRTSQREGPGGPSAQLPVFIVEGSFDPD